MTLAMYPGSFDPVHVGHVDVVDVASRLFDQVIVVAMYNPDKAGYFPLDQREALLAETFGHLDNVKTVSAPGLVVQAAADLGADVIVKGVRGPVDLDVEMQMAHTNKSVTGIQTVFVPTEPPHSFISSRYIREINNEGGDVSHLVPDAVAAALAARSRSRS